MSGELSGKTVAILCGAGVEKLELVEPRAALDAAGATTVLISPAESPITSWNMVAWDESFVPDITLEPEGAQAADRGEYDALLLPGGPLNSDILRANDYAIFWVKQFFLKQNKPVAVLCHAPWMLVEADVLRGRRLTGFPAISTDITNAGGTFIDAAVVRDGNLVTCRHPGDTAQFNPEMVDLFATWDPATSTPDHSRDTVPAR